MITITFAKEIKNTVDVQVFTTIGDKLNARYVSVNQKKNIQTALKQAGFKDNTDKIIDLFGGEIKTVVAGVKKDSDELAYQTLGGKLASRLSADETVVYYADGAGLSDTNEAVNVAFGLLLGSYRFDKYKTKEKKEDKSKLKKVIFIVENPNEAKKLFKDKQIIAESVCFARDLCNEPANALTPKIYASKINALEKTTGLSVDVLTLNELKEKKFGMLLSVAQGSVNEPRVVVIKWRGNPKKKGYDVGLVGKGVTFDSGGISLKPGAGMGAMKQDMTGSAVVTATLNACALREVKMNVIGIVGLVENMPSGSATRPGDIVTSLSGQTVEILNTDAEGRLVLGDCLWYIQSEYGVKKVIDVATLTGAIAVALGEEYAGLFTNNDDFAGELRECGKQSGEELWRMPMNKAFDKMIDSPVADMKNIGGRNAGSSTAACFLGRFIQEGTVWAHLDIAGVDDTEKGTPICPKGATGWGVRLLSTLIK